CGPLRSGKRCARQQALDATAHQPFGLGPFRSRAQATVSARRVSFEIPSLARFRVNAFNQNRGAGAVFRTIPSEVLTLEDLGCPP
ncbi:hypothetical protein QT526_22450, partial [Xanthomonas citri pv. citri]